jgi:4-hydroxyphenylpyruvate dioxygenase
MKRSFEAPQFPVSAFNPCGLDGIEFIEFASDEPERLDQLFTCFGFQKTLRHFDKAIDVYQQGDITFVLNRDSKSFAAQFRSAHGPCIVSMGWRVAHGPTALQEATKRGARARHGDLVDAPAIAGIGDSLIYFVDHSETSPWARFGFVPLRNQPLVSGKGFFAIDHLTNNVEKGTLKHWAHFYESVFGFQEVRYFDIRGAKTGLTSFALRSPCGRFCIPINEANEQKSQINEYLEEYRGPGIQHVALLTNDILASLRQLEGSPLQFLDIEPDYYQTLFERFPSVTENREEIQRRNVLVDGDENGYLLQLFTKNLIGPIFFELIQRKNHLSFGEGNFGALFRSIERDQQRRGVFDDEFQTRRDGDNASR